MGTLRVCYSDVKCANTITAANRFNVVADAISTSPEDLAGLSSKAPEYQYRPQNVDEKPERSSNSDKVRFYADDGIERPTEEERLTLRRVAGRFPWSAYALCAVEFAERASYYGCQGVFSNFVQFPLP